MSDRFLSSGESLFLGQLLTMEQNASLKGELQEIFRGSDIPLDDMFQQNALEVGVFAGCNLKGAILNGFKLHGLVLDKCDLSNASLQTTRLTSISFARANIHGCNFRGARLD